MKINLSRIKKRLFRLAQIGGNPETGWTRLAFTPEDELARKIIKEYMHQADLELIQDDAGNIRGKTRQNCAKSPVVALGSHLDTVPSGGMFDGCLGVISALEVAQVLKENHIQTKHPLEIIVFANEEGSRFGNGLFGSRALAGLLEENDLHYADQNGITIKDALQKLHLDPQKIAASQAEPGHYKAFFELHIEQGEQLTTNNVSLGLVHTIAGPKWLKCILEGTANHAGATAMLNRNDPLLTASKIVQVINEIALQVGGDFVATVGKLDVFPNTINTIPGRVEFTIDIRDTELKRRTQGVAKIVSCIQKIAGSAYTMLELEETVPVKLAPNLVDLGQRICLENNFSFMTLASGAAHDAQIMSNITDAALIFIPSTGGKSHCPQENIDWQDADRGTQLMLKMVLATALD